MKCQLSLLQEAEKLVTRKIHPQTIAAGWRKSVKVAEEALKSAAIDHGNDEAKFKEDLMNIARTTLSSKILVHNRDHFASLAVDAVLRLRVSFEQFHFNLECVVLSYIIHSTFCFCLN